MKINPNQKYKIVDKDFINGSFVLTGKELNTILEESYKELMQSKKEAAWKLLNALNFTDKIKSGEMVLEIDFLDEEFRTYSDTPVIAMGYTNSFINPSSELIATKLSECGFNGILIVDLPASEKSIINSFKNNQLNLVQLIAPTTQQNPVSYTQLPQPPNA